MSETTSDTAQSTRADFDLMNLQPGTRLQFLTHRGRTPTQHISVLVGLEMDEYLLLKLPREAGMPLNFFDGEKISVRVFSGTAICTFDTSVMRTLQFPLYCLCVAFPRAIQMKKLRREMRIKTAVPASVTPDGAAAPVHVELGNLSATGGLIRTDAEIGNLDDVIRLTFSLPGTDVEAPEVISTKAKIRNISAADATAGIGAKRFSVGTEFVELDSTHQLMLLNHVYEALLDSRQNVV